MNNIIEYRIKENSWLAKLAAWRLGSENMAMVIGHTIHLHNSSRLDFLRNQSWVNHELCHIRQYQERGIIGFLWAYTMETLRNGYARNRFELEAIEAESRPMPDAREIRS